MARNALPPEDKKVLSNYYLPPRIIARLKEIAFRRSVAKMRRVSEATMVEIGIRNLPMPRQPSPEKIAQYEALKSSKKKGGGK